MPIGRAVGLAMKRARCSTCRSQTRVGRSISIGLPISSSAGNPNVVPTWGLA